MSLIITPDQSLMQRAINGMVRQFKRATHRMAPGTIEPVVYFVKVTGYHRDVPESQRTHIVAPDNRHPTPVGFVRREARTLREVDAVTKIMNRQDRKWWEDLTAKDKALFQARRDGIKRRLERRKLEASCTDYERKFIDGALAYMERKQKQMYDVQVTGYFHAREMDSATTEKGL